MVRTRNLSDINYPEILIVHGERHNTISRNRNFKKTA
jgi:hypothetical protein